MTAQLTLMSNLHHVLGHNREIKEALEDAKKEQEAHSVARKGRRTEAKERLAFPETGSVKYTNPWEQLARDNSNWDHGQRGARWEQASPLNASMRSLSNVLDKAGFPRVMLGLFQCI